MRVKIEVTARDIRLGKNEADSNTRCPVSLALKRVITERFDGMGYDGFWPEDSNERVYFPAKVLRFQDKLFDNLPVKPFSFTINLPAA